MTDNTSNKMPGCDEFDPNALTVEQARSRILEKVNPVCEIESLPIREALNRVLAMNVESTIDVPSHINSAMDGYAIRASDIPTDASRTLQITGTVMAGTPLTIAIAEGECARIMTGGKMPEGTDTVIMQEHVERVDDTITITAGHNPGQNVRQAGEDLARGDTVFRTGRQFTPADIGMLASMGNATTSVFRKPKVAFFSTGDELCSVGQPLGDGQIYDSNRYTLDGMLRRLDVEIIDMGIIPDQRDLIEAAFAKATAEADIVVTTGGVSVGEADFVKETMDKLGQIGFWKIAMKPGRPLAFGQVNNCLLFGLPGNPVSAMVTFYQFVQPAILGMMGIAEVLPKFLQLKTKNKLRKRPGRLEFQRGVISTATTGEMVVESTGAQGSGILSSMSEANCFIELPLECSSVEAGDTVKVQPFAGLI
ncbi:MAG: molybdopterin molybdotransferase MoeA [Ectothiorhodospiraceae bacterium]|nr:molybdopterin molybdotransferase MoeA [Ectothiorhodospiraceae bacterium]